MTDIPENRSPDRLEPDDWDDLEFYRDEIAHLASDILDIVVPRTLIDDDDSIVRGRIIRTHLPVEMSCLDAMILDLSRYADALPQIGQIAPSDTVIAVVMGDGHVDVVVNFNQRGVTVPKDAPIPDVFESKIATVILPLATKGRDSYPRLVESTIQLSLGGDGFNVLSQNHGLFVLQDQMVFFGDGFNDLFQRNCRLLTDEESDRLLLILDAVQNEVSREYTDGSTE